MSAPEIQVLPDGRKLVYPPLTADEMRIIRVLSKGLFISRYSLSRAFYEATAGNLSRLNKLARRMALHRPLEVMIDDSGDD